MEKVLNFQMPNESLELVILLHTYTLHSTMLGGIINDSINCFLSCLQKGFLKIFTFEKKNLKKMPSEF